MRMPFIPDHERTHQWLHLALRHTAHGFDLELPNCPTPYDVDQHLLSWEQAGWIMRGEFAPDLSQRALCIVHPDRLATMDEARKVLEFGKQMKVDFYQSAYWWLPGPKADEALTLLPTSKELQVGEKVRYRRGYLRNIGMANDDEMLRWRGIVLERTVYGKDFQLLLCKQEPVSCHCCLGRPPVEGKSSFEDDCFRCGGTGQATRMRTSPKTVELA